jgi:predicted anti-sigma-YlaC factor YlaD
LSWTFDFKKEIIMSCDEIREQLVDLVYDEGADSKVQEHLRACPACREEAEELRRTRKYLQLWKDEAPLKSVLIARCEKIANRNTGFRYIRYAAVAAMILISLLAIANTKVSWNKDGFTFSAHLFEQHSEEKDYYTKAELRDLMKEALDYTNETNYLVIQQMRDAEEQARWRDIRLIQNKAVRNHN